MKGSTAMVSPLWMMAGRVSLITQISSKSSAITRNRVSSTVTDTAGGCLAGWRLAAPAIAPRCAALRKLSFAVASRNPARSCDRSRSARWPPPHGMAPALITFESPELYRLHNAAGFWGPVTSSVDWCVPCDARHIP